jgi:hypothetical protein
VKHAAGLAASRRSFSARSATRTPTTSWFGTRGFFGVTRSIQTHTNFFSLPLLETA